MLISLLALILAAGEPAASAPELLKRGVKLREQHKDQEAFEVFRQAHELSHDPRALAQMALAEAALGRWLDAEAHLMSSLESAQDVWIVKNRTTLEMTLQNIRQQHLGSLDVSCNVKNAEIVVNGHPAGRSPLDHPIRAPAGSAVLEVSAEGYWPSSRSVTIPAGGLGRETVDLTARPEAAAPAPYPGRAPPPPLEAPLTAPPPPTAQATRTGPGAWFWVLGSGAVAGLATGVTGLAIGESRAVYHKTECEDPTQPAKTGCDSVASEAETARIVGYAGFGVGAVLGVLATIVLFSHDDDPSLAQLGPGPSGTTGTSLHLTF